MADISLFQDEAFSVPNLAAAINEQPYVPGRIGELGLFNERGVSTTVVQIEYDGATLKLVAAKPRGGVADITTLGPRKLIPFNTVHLPQRSTMLADEIQSIRAFGSQSELETAVARVASYQATHRTQLDMTHEFQRIGAIKGQILDADGETVLLDVYQAFNIEQTSFSMALGDVNTIVRDRCDDVLDLIETALGATPTRSARALCGREFWKKLTSHKSVRETYLNTAQAAELRGELSGSFEIGGISFERYRGSMKGKPYVPANEAFAFPEGVPEFFITRFAPGDYLETVNTDGLPYYSRVEVLPYGKGLGIESQSNPLHIPTRPKAVIRLTAGA
ncbi:major capsid protein [Verticiella sediminum]|uniref:Major capsid protein n=1 Tax=Verticiella sediminum TaxID=1247510 RepID=A0A556AIB7_9BURK|nr:major capsid protein [Verticiella sediminum]TSH92630.1 major capsid protein [Verticiella sediminum]